MNWSELVDYKRIQLDCYLETHTPPLAIELIKVRCINNLDLIGYED